MSISKNLLAKAKAYFDQHEQYEELILTSDGTVFFPENAKFAKNHAVSNKLEVSVVSREDVRIVEPAEEPTPKKPARKTTRKGSTKTK